MLAAARNGDKIRTHVALVPPEDHTNDYDRVIDMLEMSIDEEITIDQNSFRAYVRDEWAWMEQARVVNTMYATGGKMSGGLS